MWWHFIRMSTVGSSVLDRTIGIEGMRDPPAFPQLHASTKQNAMRIAIKDETFAGDILNEIELEFVSELVTVRDIIEARVLQEVERYNSKRPEFFNGLVEPSDAERTLNGFKLKSKRIVDGEKQVYVALEAFQRNGFFMLVDDKQAGSLEEEVRLSKSTRISFVKLTPLVGG